MEIKKLLATTALLALTAPAFADTVMISGEIDGTEDVFDNPLTGATTLTFFDAFDFSVDADGEYSFLGFYPGDTDADENMDGYLVLFEGAADIGGDDDYSAGDIGALGGFDGACVGANCSGFSANLMAGVTYTLVVTTFTDAPTSFGQPSGPYDLTLTGPGTITVVPVPAAVWLMVSGLAGLCFFRRK